MENAAVASGARPTGTFASAVSVLVVEEDPSDLTILLRLLQRRGYKVTARESPEEGLRALCDNPEAFDLVMTVVRTKGPGIDGFELLRHAVNRCPVILFSGYEQPETVMRGVLGGACDFLAKPLRDEEVRNLWQHVLRRRVINAASGAAAAIPGTRRSVVVVRPDDTATTSPDLYASFLRAAELLRGTEDCCVRGIRDLLEAQGIQVTIEQVASQLEKYIRDRLDNGHLSAMPTENYSKPGSSGFYMRPQGATYINQTSLLANGASPAGCSILGHESYRASHAGLLYNNGNRHGSANGNCSGKFGNGNDYRYGNGNDKANANGCHNGNGRGGILVANGNMVRASLPSSLAQPVQQAMQYGKDHDYQYGNGNLNDNANSNGCQNGNGRAGFLVNPNMASASLPSNLAPQVHQVMPEGYGNGRGGILAANGKMVSASLQSNLAQPVQQAMPKNRSFPSSMRRTIDNLGHIGQQAFPHASQLRYDGSTGGISMSPWPVDDNEDMLRSCLETDDEILQNTASTGMTQGMHGDGAGQISASQPKDLTGLLSSESSNGNGAAGTSGRMSDEILDCDFTADEMDWFYN